MSLETPTGRTGNTDSSSLWDTNSQSHWRYQQPVTLEIPTASRTGDIESQSVTLKKPQPVTLESTTANNTGDTDGHTGDTDGHTGDTDSQSHWRHWHTVPQRDTDSQSHGRHWESHWRQSYWRHQQPVTLKTMRASHTGDTDIQSYKETQTASHTGDINDQSHQRHWQPVTLETLTASHTGDTGSQSH